MDPFETNMRVYNDNDGTEIHCRTQDVHDHCNDLQCMSNQAESMRNKQHLRNITVLCDWSHACEGGLRKPLEGFS